MPIRIDNVVDTNNISLQFHQFNEIFLLKKVNDKLLLNPHYTNIFKSYSGVDVVSDVVDDVFQLNPGLITVVVIYVSRFVCFQQSYIHPRNKNN